MLLILILLLTTIPIIEIFLLLQVGEAIGTWNTVGIVIFTGLLGAYALRTQGRAIFRRLELKLYRGELPTNPIVHSLFILIGGILMITPGLLTDLVGFVWSYLLLALYSSVSLKVSFANLVKYMCVPIEPRKTPSMANGKRSPRRQKK